MNIIEEQFPLKDYLKTEADLDYASEYVFSQLMEDLCLGLCFEVHRSAKVGTFHLDDLDRESEKNYQVVDKPGLDIFGQLPTIKKQYECICPNCQRNMAASRFAPHLEKCMGMGRNSSRLANRRLMASSTNNSSNSNHNSTNNNFQRQKDSISDLEDNEDDEWTYTSENRKAAANKKKREHKSHISPRKTKSSKNSNKSTASSTMENPGSSSSCGSGSYTTSAPATLLDNHSPTSSVSSVLEAMENTTTTKSASNKPDLLHMCGVVSEHTGKMCIRSVRCPQHSEEQRKAVRAALLRASPSVGQALGSADGFETITLDSDSYDGFRDSKTDV